MFKRRRGLVLIEVCGGIAVLAVAVLLISQTTMQQRQHLGQAQQQLAIELSLGNCIERLRRESYSTLPDSLPRIQQSIAPEIVLTRQSIRSDERRGYHVTVNWNTGESNGITADGITADGITRAEHFWVWEAETATDVDTEVTDES